MPFCKYRFRVGSGTYLQLNLGLGNVLLAAAAVGDLLCLGDLSPDGLGAEVLQGVRLDGVDAQGGVGLDDGESTRDCSMVFTV